MSEMTTAPAAASETRLTGKQRKAIVAGSIGNTVEWVDWAVYGTLAPVFASQFFAKGDPAAALLSTLAVFAVGFVMRPVGGALLGVYADRHGRKKGLTLTIGLMAGAALVIAVCPTYEAIGIAAPLILLLARLVQGFSAGGEFGSSSSFLVESAAPRRRAFAGSWQQVSVGAGALIASLMGFVLTSTLSEADMQSWGWRIAFGIGGLLGLVGLWLRVSVEETDSFRKADDDGRTRRRNPLVGMLVEHPRAALRVVGITIAGTLIYYVWISYMPGYAHAATGIPLRDALLANTIAIAYFLCLLPFVALLSDRFGRKPALVVLAMLSAALPITLFSLMAGASANNALLGAVLLALVAGGVSAVGAIATGEQFTEESRASGLGLGYTLATAIFGGLTPWVAQLLLDRTGWPEMPGLMIAVVAIAVLPVFVLMRETAPRRA